MVCFNLGKAAQLVKSGHNFWLAGCVDRGVHCQISNRRGVDHRHHRHAVGRGFPRLFIQRRDGLSDRCHDVYVLLALTRSFSGFYPDFTRNLPGICPDLPGPEPSIFTHSASTDNNRTGNAGASSMGAHTRGQAAQGMPMRDSFMSFFTWKQQHLSLNNATETMKCCSTA